MRIFIAVEIPHEIREKIYKDLVPLRKTFPKVKWIRPENLHLTLKFLGEVSEKKLKVIHEKISDLSSFKSFSIKFLGLGGFPNLSRPKVIWMGIDQGEEELSNIASYLESELEKVGFHLENRSFQAHLTLARVKDFREVKGFCEKASFFDKTSFASFSVNMVSLIQSSLTREGATYQCLHQIRLG